MGDVAGEIFEALNHELRRALLRELCQTPEQACDLDELLESTSETIDEPSTIEQIALHCYHHHLPKLDDAGLVSYDWEEREITYAGSCDPDELQRVLGYKVVESE